MDLLLTAGLVFARVAAMVAVLPVISASEVPRAVPIFLALGVTIIIAPGMPVIEGLEAGPGLLLGVAGEVLLGSALGLGVRAIFGAMAMACELASMQMGLAMAQQFNPMQLQMTGPLATLCSWVVGLVFVMSGLHLRCLETVAHSFSTLEPGSVGIHSGALEVIVDAVGLSMSLGVQLAGPLILMAWMVNVLVGVLGRLAPKMNVFLSIGMTLSSGMGVMLVFFALPWMLVAHEAFLREAVVNMWRLVSVGGV
jgi:flagellar biosynthetic protein FliR